VPTVVSPLAATGRMHQRLSSDRNSGGFAQPDCRTPRDQDRL